MKAARNLRGDWAQGSAPAVNPVFYVPGTLDAYSGLAGIEAGRYSRKQKLLLVAIPVAPEAAATGASVEFVIAALHQANAIAAEVHAKKGPEPFDLGKADAIVEKVRDALFAQGF